MLKIKKVISVVIAAALLCTLVLSGCSSSTPATTAAPETTAAPAETQGQETEAPETEAPETETEEVDDGSSYTFSVNTPQPAESAAGKLLQATCDRITEETGGRLTFDVYFSGQLLTVFDTVSGVSNGLADIAFLPTSTSPDYFPINGKLLILPFLGMPGDDSINDVYATLCEEFPEIEGEVEAQNMKTLSTFFFLREDLYFTGDDKVEKVEDFAGKKIGVSNSYVGKLINNAGGAPVTVTQGDVYTTVESGVVDGLVHHDAFIRAGGAVELFHSVTMFGDEGMVREMGKFFMNLDSYNQLPSTLKKVLEDNFQQLAKDIAAADLEVSAGVKGQLQGAGCTFTELTEEQVAPFKEAAKAVQDECISELEGNGIPAQAIFDRLQDLCK